MPFLSFNRYISFFSVTLQTVKFLGKQIKFKMKRSFKDYALLALKGMGMGAADVVPGVSGGTIAFIVGIYDELIDSIKSINAQSLKMFLPGSGELSGR